jgi:Xaa-Pro aminopeptidase
MLLTQVPSYFKARREALVNLVSKTTPGAAFVFPSSTEVLRNPDVHHPFRQESNFYYLSGFEEPESWLVIAPKKSKPGSYRSVLFVRKRDPEMEIWDGERYGVEGALKVFGVDEAYLSEQFEEKACELLSVSEALFYRVGLSENLDRRMQSVLERVRRSQGRAGKSLLPVLDPNEPVGEMRLFKSAEEIALLRKACEISAEAHRTAMREVRPGMNEYEIEALIDYTFRRRGCARVGYGSIIAGGKNATCLHYQANNEVLRDGDLLLVDAGGEYGYYTADITRTFPVGREFTDAQAQIYDLVLRAQKETMAIAKPGTPWTALHKRATESLVDGLIGIGLLKGKVEDILKNPADVRRFYPHGTGHWLGMDVHDVGLYQKNGEPRRLEPGMVFTIEPGLYMQPSDQGVPERFRNIGVRIEDNILITKDGCENLTQNAPKERSEIESLKS